MSLAINRREIIDNIAQADQLPSTGWTPEGMPGFDTINPESPWLPENGDLEQAKQLMYQVAEPEGEHHPALNDSPGHREIAVAIQAAWSELGLNVEIRQQEWHSSSSSRVRRSTLGRRVPLRLDRRLRRRDELPRALDVRVGEQLPNYCDPAYDRLVEQARRTRTTRSGTSCTGRWRTRCSVRTARCR